MPKQLLLFPIAVFNYLMNLIKLIIFLQLLNFSLLAQELDTVIIHTGSFSQTGDLYMINGKEVEKEVFLKYDQEFKDAKSCCPCLIQRYSLSEELQSEQIRCNDTLITTFRRYKNGQIKTISHFVMNDTTFPHYSIGKSDLYAYDGEWVVLNPEGDTISSTTWKNGEFIKETPTPLKSSIWGLKAWYNGQNLRQVSTMKRFNKFKFKPLYKTKDRTALVQISITITDRNSNSWQGSATHKTLKKLDIKKIAKQNNLTLDENTLIYLQFTDANLLGLGAHVLRYNGS